MSDWLPALEREEQSKVHPWINTVGQSPSLVSIAKAIAAKPNCVVLDAGCGNGELLRLLRELGVQPRNLFGCDVEQSHVDLARERTSLSQIVRCDFSVKQPFCPRMFDYIVAIGWIHNHWASTHKLGEREQQADPRYLAHVARNVKLQLTAGGTFLFDWPNEQRLRMKDFVWQMRRRQLKITSAIPTDPVVYGAEHFEYRDERTVRT